MAAFYKYVIFKKSEYELELQKYRNAMQINKIIKKDSEIEKTNEKGLLICNLNLYQPMEIDFINKPGSQLIQYDQQQAIGMKVNNLMPEVVQENHLKFIERFL
jgi:hypothetical protein